MSGFEKLTRDLSEAQKAISALDGEIGTVNFDPNDPASIEAAVEQIEALLDERLADYISNPIVGPMLEALKERYRERIIERAAAARLGQDQE